MYEEVLNGKTPISVIDRAGFLKLNENEAIFDEDETERKREKNIIDNLKAVYETLKKYKADREYDSEVERNSRDRLSLSKF